jgi:endonuclease/exonuclease/phosphatase family metal-dependent hydrolase
MFRRRSVRVLAVIFGLIGLITLYRVLAVYRFRAGECEAGVAMPSTRLDTAPAKLRVMTYNIEGHATLVRGDEHIRRIAETIRHYQPDVVALNEIHRGTWQARFGSHIDDLERLTGMKLVFAPSFTVFGGDFGNGILSRGDVISTRAIALPGTGEPRTLLGATIRSGGGTYEVYVTHTTAWAQLNARTRGEQLDCVADAVKGTRYPTIVAGDMNAEPESAELRDFIRGSGLRLVAPKLAPTHRVMEQALDHIYISPEWSVSSVVVSAAGPSDHRPVIADLRPSRSTH